MGLIKGAKNYRLNSPYLPQPRPPSTLTDLDEELLAAAPAGPPSKSAAKKKKSPSKATAPISPITQMYKALTLGQYPTLRSARPPDSRDPDPDPAPDLQAALLSKAVRIIQSAAAKETHKRMMLLVHTHKDKKPFTVPKIDASAEFGGSVRSTDEKYSEFYKYKLGINDRQQDEEPLYHEEHVLHFQGQDGRQHHAAEKDAEDEDEAPAPSINRDPLYRIMREQAELSNLAHGQQSKLKSVKSTPAPAFIEANANYVMTTRALSKLSAMHKPSSEAWCTMRAVYTLMLAFHELTVRDSAIMHVSGSASAEAPNNESPSNAEHASSASSSGDASGNRTAAGAAAVQQPATDEMFNVGRTRKFWQSIFERAQQLDTTPYTVCSTFSWDLVVDLLLFPSEFLHALGDVEAGEVSVPKFFPITRVAAGSREVAWRTGSFYRAAESDDRLLGVLRAVVGTGAFHPSDTWKSAPCVSALCSWARSVVAGIFSGKMVMNRSSAKFPRVASKAYDPSHSLDSSLAEDSVSVSSTMLASALMNISQTLPPMSVAEKAATFADSIASFALEESGRSLSLSLSPAKRIGHFIEMSTLQSSALREDLPEALMAATAAVHAKDAYVPHQMNSELDSGSALHVIAYVPASRFPSSPELLQNSSPECSVFDVAIRLGRPCDRVDILLGNAVRRELAHEDVALQYFQMRVMTKSRSPLHRVLAPPYAATVTSAQQAGAELPMSGVVSFAQMRRTKLPPAAAAATSDARERSAASAAHSLKDLLAGNDADDLQDGSLLESTEDALLEFVRECLQVNMRNRTHSMNLQAMTAVGGGNPFPMLVLVKGLNHVFQCPKYVSSYDDKKYNRTIMLVPPQTGTSTNTSPYACVSRFVCMISHGDRSRAAFQTALRLSKPGDVLLLVHVLRRSASGAYDEAAAHALVKLYQKLGFNLEVVAEDEVAPRGTRDNVLLGKALVTAAAAHAPTHMVLGADHYDTEFALFQNSAGAKTSVVEGVIRQEKFLCSMHHAGENGGRPVLVLGAYAGRE